MAGGFISIVLRETKLFTEIKMPHDLTYYTEYNRNTSHILNYYLCSKSDLRQVSSSILLITYLPFFQIS